jgi:hypothetical protein
VKTGTPRPGGAGFSLGRYGGTGMGSLNITYSYVGLEKAGALLGVSFSDLLHAGAFNQVQICVNIYARADGFKMQLIDVAIDRDYSDIDAKLKT